MPENESAVSLSAGRAARMRNPRSPASSRPASQRVVFPAPASPSTAITTAPDGNARHEIAKGRKLGRPSHDARGHDPTIVSLALGRG